MDIHSLTKFRVTSGGSCEFPYCVPKRAVHPKRAAAGRGGDSGASLHTPSVSRTPLPTAPEQIPVTVLHSGHESIRNVSRPIGVGPYEFAPDHSWIRTRTSSSRIITTRSEPICRSYSSIVNSVLSRGPSLTDMSSSNVPVVEIPVSTSTRLSAGRSTLSSRMVVSPFAIVKWTVLVEVVSLRTSTEMGPRGVGGDMLVGASVDEGVSVEPVPSEAVHPLNPTDTTSGMVSFTTSRLECLMIVQSSKCR